MTTKKSPQQREPRRSYIQGIEESNRKFFAALDSEDDLAAILRMHSFIEHELKEFILTVAPHPEHVKFSSLDYAATLQLALILGLNADLRAGLSAIAGLRNRFAHQLDAALLKQDATNLYEALSADCKADVQQGYANITKNPRYEHLPKSMKELPPRMILGTCVMSLRGAIIVQHLRIHRGRIGRSPEMAPVRELDNERTDAGWLSREIFSSFGQALFSASLLRSQLLFALTVGEFLPRFQKKAARVGGVSKQQYSHDLEIYKKTYSGRKIEHIIHRLQAINLFDNSLIMRMMDAAKHHNFLMHNFVEERTMSLMSVQGMLEVDEELEGYSNSFDALIDDIGRAIQPLEIKLGLDPAESEAFAKQIVPRFGVWEDD